MLWSICHRCRRKGVPRQRIRKWCHGNISVPVAHGDTGAKGSMAWAWHARWWGDPGYRVPTRRWHGNEEEHASDNFEHGANAGISCIANIRSRKVISAVIPLKRAFSKRIQFVKGSSGTWAIVEVVVLATVVEVVAHVRFRRGTWRVRGLRRSGTHLGSGSWRW